MHATLCEQRDEFMRLKENLPAEDQHGRRFATERRIKSLLDMLFAAVHTFESATS